MQFVPFSLLPAFIRRTGPQLGLHSLASNSLQALLSDCKELEPITLGTLPPLPPTALGWYFFISTSNGWKAELMLVVFELKAPGVGVGFRSLWVWGFGLTVWLLGWDLLLLPQNNQILWGDYLGNGNWKELVCPRVCPHVCPQPNSVTHYCCSFSYF